MIEEKIFLITKRQLIYVIDKGKYSSYYSTNRHLVYMIDRRKYSSYYKRQQSYVIDRGK